MDSLIFDIQRFCVYDGPGIRTTVFFKGCNMRCKWCHNPESFSVKTQLLFHKDKCIDCSFCTDCTQHVHFFDEIGHHVDRSKCVSCGLCTELCSEGALELSGKTITADEVMKIIDKDAKYYASSCGGVTFSGGEASMHAELLTDLLHRCRERGYHTALETNGLMSRETLNTLLPLVDLFLLDLKHTDAAAHKAWTGAPLQPVLDTLSVLNEHGANVTLRCVIIPSINDHAAHFDAVKAIVKAHPCVKGVEIMPYHDIGKVKWHALGMEYSLEALKSASPDDKRRWEAMVTR